MYEVLIRVVKEYSVFLQKRVDLHSGLETKQTAHLSFAQAVAPVPFQSNRFEDAPGSVLWRSVRRRILPESQR